MAEYIVESVVTNRKHGLIAVYRLFKSSSYSRFRETIYHLDMVFSVVAFKSIVIYYEVGRAVVKLKAMII